MASDITFQVGVSTYVGGALNADWVSAYVTSGMGAPF
jgi:hypothetical protein